MLARYARTVRLGRFVMNRGGHYDRDGSRNEPLNPFAPSRFFGALLPPKVCTRGTSQFYTAVHSTSLRSQNVKRANNTCHGFTTTITNIPWSLVAKGLATSSSEPKQRDFGGNIYMRMLFPFFLFMGTRFPANFVISRVSEGTE